MAESIVPITLEDIRADERIGVLIEHADQFMEAIGYTEHGFRHANLTANIAINVLKRLGFTERDVELAGIAGYLHDIGNVIGRDFHGIASATLVKTELDRLGTEINELALILNAIGNHEEDYGADTTAVGAAVVLADKSDVHRTRVRNPDPMDFDIHDRVNFAAERSFLRVEPVDHVIQLEIDIDTSISQVMEYFEIFLSRMVRCRRAAQFLGCKFSLMINKTKLL
ncbi:MAG: HD domain-containing protein [Actinobacteria bacterium]|nr:HD domain-containing protein [Actinomycetota bacterium]